MLSENSKKVDIRKKKHKNKEYSLNTLCFQDKNNERFIDDFLAKVSKYWIKIKKSWIFKTNFKDFFVHKIHWQPIMFTF